jgi:hypothetical protein
MGRHLVFVDLPKDGRSVADRLGLPAEQASRQARDIACESKLRSWADAYRQSGIIRRREPTRSGAEISRDESICHFCRPRPHALKAKVTHLAIPFFPVLQLSPAAVPITHIKQDWCRALATESCFQRPHARRRRSARIFRCLALVTPVCCLAKQDPACSLASAAPGSRRNFRQPAPVAGDHGATGGGAIARQRTVMPPTMPSQSWSPQRKS